MEDSLRGKLLIASPALDGPQLRALGRAHDRALGGRRDGHRPQPPRRRRRARADAGARGRSPATTRSSSAVPCSRRRSCFWPSSPIRAPRPGSSSPTSASPRPTTDFDELGDAVRRGRFYAGYSGWGPGQLEVEIEIESWIVEPPLPAELFPDDPESLWSDVLARKGRLLHADLSDARRPEHELSHCAVPSLEEINPGVFTAGRRTCPTGRPTRAGRRGGRRRSRASRTRATDALVLIDPLVDRRRLGGDRRAGRAPRRARRARHHLSVARALGRGGDAALCQLARSRRRTRT